MTSEEIMALSDEQLDGELERFIRVPHAATVREHAREARWLLVESRLSEFATGIWITVDRQHLGYGGAIMATAAWMEYPEYLDRRNRGKWKQLTASGDTAMQAFARAALMAIGRRRIVRRGHDARRMVRYPADPYTMPRDMLDG